LSNTEKALKFASLGFSVFPADPSTKQPYYKEGVIEHGHLDSTTESDTIATWFSLDFPNAEVGIHAGASEVIVLDVDVDESKDKSGYDSLGFLDIPETYSYTSRSGKGKHFIYDLADSPFIPPANRYRHMEGVDRKSGSSYVVAWGEPPESRDELAGPPEWLLDIPSDVQVHTGFTGDVDDWFAGIPLGEPTATVRQIIDTLPTSNFGHAEVLSITFRLVRLAAEGHTGVDWAFDELWRKWVRPPYDSPELKKELQDAIFGAIKKAGDEDERIAQLPAYMDSLDLASGKLIDYLLSPPKGKSTYFHAIKMGLAESLRFDTIASLVWGAPGTQEYARDWGIGYLYDSIISAAEKSAYETGEGVSGPEEDEEESEKTSVEVQLLKPSERERIKDELTFVDRYSMQAATRVAKQNKPYDDMNGWTVLSCWASMLGYIPRKNGREGLNSFGMILGETTSGKSASRKLMMMALKEIFLGDPAFNIGGNPSPSALAQKLLTRNNLVSFFNKDEAHGAMKTWIGADWTSGLLEQLADYYDGWVSAELRTSDKENSGKAARTHFIMHLQATPKAMIELLNRELFETGFLARFIWAIGWPREVTYDSMAEEDSEGDEEKLGFDPYSRQLSAELTTAKRMVTEGTGESMVKVRIDSKASKRLQDAKWMLNQMFEKDANFDILQPALVRMGVMIRKAASMVVLSEGRWVITERDILLALRAAEDWTSALATVAQQIVASDWQRATEEIRAFIESLPNKEAKRERVLRKFKHIEGPRMEQYIASLIGQGYIYEFGAGGGAKMLGAKNRE